MSTSVGKTANYTLKTPQEEELIQLQCNRMRVKTRRPQTTAWKHAYHTDTKEPALKRHHQNTFMILLKYSEIVLNNDDINLLQNGS